MPTPQHFENISGNWEKDIGSIKDSLHEKRQDFVTVAARNALQLHRDMARADVESSIDDALVDNAKNFVLTDLEDLEDFNVVIESGQTMTGILTKYFKGALKQGEYPSDVTTAADKKSFISRQVSLTLYYLEKEGQRVDGEALNVDKIFAGSKLSIVEGELTVERGGETIIDCVPLRPNNNVRARPRPVVRGGGEARPDVRPRPGPVTPDPTPRRGGDEPQPEVRPEPVRPAPRPEPRPRPEPAPAPVTAAPVTPEPAPAPVTAAPSAGPSARSMGMFDQVALINKLAYVVDGKLDLSELTTLDKEGAEMIASVSQIKELELDGLTTLDKGTAEALAQAPQLKVLWLNGLTTLEQGTAEALAQAPQLVGLGLKGLTTLDKGTAEALAQAPRLTRVFIKDKQLSEDDLASLAGSAPSAAPSVPSAAPTPAPTPAPAPAPVTAAPSAAAEKRPSAGTIKIPDASND